jgi:hypothetical protein
MLPLTAFVGVSVAEVRRGFLNIAPLPSKLQNIFAGSGWHDHH